jgi:hypothetical protein
MDDGVELVREGEIPGEIALQNRQLRISAQSIRKPPQRPPPGDSRDVMAPGKEPRQDMRAAEPARAGKQDAYGL